MGPPGALAEKRLFEIIPEHIKVRLVEPNIYSVYPQAENIGSYDKTGGIYDAVACNRLFYGATDVRTSSVHE
ncbi:MAG: hypothetical protein HY913_04990 [Desulfomonile tiedjei]|nr:hypothetical protein [Desulfomonile tiedjei]